MHVHKHTGRSRGMRAARVTARSGPMAMPLAVCCSPVHLERNILIRFPTSKQPAQAQALSQALLSSGSRPLCLPSKRQMTALK